MNSLFRLKLKHTPIHLSCNDVFQLGSSDSESSTTLSLPPVKKRCGIDLTLGAFDQISAASDQSNASDAESFSQPLFPSDFSPSISTLKVLFIVIVYIEPQYNELHLLD